MIEEEDEEDDVETNVAVDDDVVIEEDEWEARAHIRGLRWTSSVARSRGTRTRS